MMIDKYVVPGQPLPRNDEKGEVLAQPFQNTHDIAYQHFFCFL